MTTSQRSALKVAGIVLTALLVVPITLLLLRLYALAWGTLAPRFVPALAARHPELISTAPAA